MTKPGRCSALLLAAAIVTLIRRSASVLEVRPATWALVALIVLKLVAGPDMSDPSGVFWMSLGLLSRAVLIAEGDRANNGSPDTVTRRAQPVPDRRTDP